MRYSILLLISLFQFSFAQNSIERLENSPRHHEWVKINSNSNEINSFLVYPEVSEKVPVVVLIHENRGLNDWARSMTDQIAEMGYIAIAPDFLSGTAPNGGGTNDYQNSDDARKVIYNLDPDVINDILNKTVDYSKKIPSGNGKVVVIGFCWGGSQSFQFATESSEIEAAIVCYGTGPTDMTSYSNITAPVYGFYGGNDNRVNATIAASASAMKAAGNPFEQLIYDGAGHGFFRAGENQNATEANRLAREQGIQRLKEILKGL
jgi:carboxymethylenebutenolidase